MDVSYRRDKDHNYMILDAPGELTGEEYQVRMLVGNHIPHLLKCNRWMMDGKAVFFYDVTGMQPMFRVFEKRQTTRRNGLTFAGYQRGTGKHPEISFRWKPTAL